MIKNITKQNRRSIIIGIASLVFSLFSVASKGQSSVLKFNTSDPESYIDCGTFYEYISGDFTVETWMYVDSWSGNYILADESWNSTSGSVGFAFRFSADGKLEMNVGTGDWESFNSTAGVIKLNTWQHVAITMNAGNQEVKLYVDDTPVASGTLSTPMIASGTHVFMCEGSMWKDRRLDGKLFDLRIWNTARTEEEIYSNKDIQLNGSEEGLAANWLLNEGHGDSVLDLTTRYNLKRGAGTEWVQKNNIQVNGSLKILNSGKDSVLVRVSGEQISDWKLSSATIGEVTFKVVDDYSAYLIFEPQTANYRNDTVFFMAETAGGEKLNAKVPIDLYNNKYQYFGEKLLDQVHDEFYNKSNGLYAESIDASSNFIQGTSFVWPASHMLRALTSAWRLNPEKYEKLLFDYLAAIEQYKVTKAGRTGYAVLPGNTGTRFYDDNGQLMMPFCMIYDLEQDSTTLENLKIAYEFNNGIRDSRYAIPQHEDQLGFEMLFSMSVNYTSYTAAKLYQVSNETRYFNEALTYYELENDLSVKIKDSNTKLFNQASYYQNGSWSLNGTVNGNSVWGGGYRAYQTTVVIQNAILLYQLTNEQKYLDDAYEMMNSGIDQWYTPSQGLSEISFWGGDDMIDALLDMYRETTDEEFFTIAADIMDFLSTHNRDKRGYYASSYLDAEGKWNLYRTSENPSEIGMMGQAAAASSFMNVAYNSINPVTAIYDIEIALEKQSLTVFPNPALSGEEISIQVPGKKDIFCDIYFYNQSGKLIQQHNAIQLTADGKVYFRPETSSPGMYFIKLISAGKTYPAKILIH